MRQRQQQNLFIRIIKSLVRSLVAAVGAVAITLAFFLVLPLMQTLAKPPTNDLLVQEFDTAEVEPPPPPVEQEPQEEPEPEETPPELADEAPPLSLDQLTLALNPGFSDGWMAGDFAVNLNNVVSSEKSVDALFSIADLDQKPRPIYQPSPNMTKEVNEARKNGGGKVYVIFIVDEQGKVQNAKVQKSSNPAFEQSAMNAVKKWKFEPGKRGGNPVKTRMSVPITFPARG